MKKGKGSSKRLCGALCAAKKAMGGFGHSALAGAAAAAVTAGGLAGSLKDKAAGFGASIHAPQNNHQEVVTMKKSTLIALFVALAAVAGVLGALYVYVLRRERELDEYEQLLFSEDFNDDIPDDLAGPDELAADEQE